jgi:hypothetical protein
LLPLLLLLVGCGCRLFTQGVVGARLRRCCGLCLRGVSRTPLPLLPTRLCLRLLLWRLVGRQAERQLPFASLRLLRLRLLLRAWLRRQVRALLLHGAGGATQLQLLLLLLLRAVARCWCVCCPQSHVCVAGSGHVGRGTGVTRARENTRQPRRGARSVVVKPLSTYQHAQMGVWHRPRTQHHKLMAFRRACQFRLTRCARCVTADHA